MKNKLITELKQKRQTLLNELQIIEQQISMAQNELVSEKLELKRQQLRIINNDYIDIFGDNRHIRKKLFTRLDELPSYDLSRGLILKLNNLNLFYLWQVVTRPEFYYQREDKLGINYTSKLKNDIENMGLFLGMKIC